MIRFLVNASGGMSDKRVAEYEAPMHNVAEVELNEIWRCVSPEALQRTTDLARRALKAPISLLSSFTPTEQNTRSASGIEHLPAFRQMSCEACRRVVETGKPIVVTDMTADARGAIVPTEVMAYIGVPLRMSSGRDIGTLCAMDLHPHDWSPDDVELISELAAFLADQIELELDFVRRDKASREAKDARFIKLNRDLRAPLQTIVGFIDLLKRETDPDLIVTLASNAQSAAGSLRAILDRSIAMTKDSISPATLREVTEHAHQAVDGAAATEATVLRSDRPEGETRILLADDLDLNRKLIADMLGTDGHVVDCVADGAEAVKAASEQRYDVILMDMIMPGMDGIAATREIRKLPAPACDVPILALTAHSFKEQLDSCLSAGMNATLTKPMSLEALTSAVSDWTRRRKAA